MPTFHLPPDLRAELVVYAREALPDEACGFLLGTEDFHVTAVRSARNLSPHSEDRFTITPEDYAKAERHCARHAGTRILGFWHSHPRSPAQPSRVDLEEAQGLMRSFPDRYLYLIVSLARDEAELACWRLDEQGGQFEKLELRSTHEHA